MKACSSLRAVAITVVIGLSAALLACSPSSRTGSEFLSETEACDRALEAVIAGTRADDNSDAFNALVGHLETNCRPQMRIAIDYFMLSSASSRSAREVCEAIKLANPEPQAVELIHEDGFCLKSEGAQKKRKKKTWPNGGLGWNKAKFHVGTHQRVCGPLKSARTTEDGVFVNVGRDYPSAKRFTFIIWGDWWMDPIARGATICGAGNIYLYDGVTQMELGDPGQLEIWN